MGQKSGKAKAIAEESNMPVVDVISLYDNLRARSRTGRLTHSAFIDGLAGLSDGKVDRRFADSMFRYFDRDDSGTVDLREVCFALAAFSAGGSTANRLRVTFQIIDADRRGGISRDELYSSLITLNRALDLTVFSPVEEPGKPLPILTDDDYAARIGKFADRAVAKYGKGGEIDLGGFCSLCAECPFLPDGVAEMLRKAIEHADADEE